MFANGIPEVGDWVLLWQHKPFEIISRDAFEHDGWMPVNHCRRITRRPEHAPKWRFRGLMDRSRS